MLDSQITAAAAGAGVIAAALVIAADRVRVWLQPTGTHRAAEDAAQADAAVLAPSEFRYCPEEMRSTFHAIHPDGSRTCWTCWTCTGSEMSE